MPDMLVKLYELPDSSAVYKALEEKGIRIIRPMTPNKYKVLCCQALPRGLGQRDRHRFHPLSRFLFHCI